ncbi:D-glycero-beta-D-manno-heptose 1-phosphate adenylyltransferase [Streptomyces sp. TRM43335]|uniref:D-glycero-beta-D-manno-heptose 1-phosphate adenylyltransferase n=1 Tax=Streptomyces taklimakanensis TaxID=2569853 RepID=A0A6G2BHP5_9ACTN|nr:D-glycero-beta-D-manno-heptose 1-phosphate adenylyltransferase [Streptomyces taklimakanensis]MTE21770.1 D-glycero-beta-D-manno-heptose 1-phosphate adenylyltransferase [Streptomyces taklimakanensis]
MTPPTPPTPPFPAPDPDGRGRRSPATPLVVVGDALLDRDLAGHAERLAPDAPVPVLEDCEERLRPGGAALAAYVAALGGREVTLVTALGDDPAGARLRELLSPWVTVAALPMEGTLSEKTRVLAGGRPVVRMDRGDGRAAPVPAKALPGEVRAAIGTARALLVSDYGRGTADVVRDLLAERALRVPLVWDPHPRGREPVPGTRLVTPTAKEARLFAARRAEAEAGAKSAPKGARPASGVPSGEPENLHTAARLARELADAWGAASVAITLGERGALLSYGDHPLLVPAPARHSGDSCGAGDQFAASAAGLLADGALPETAVRGAVAAATGYVAAGGAGALAFPDRAAPPPSADEDAEQLVARVRAAGGTVVATGGCFDLLHAGHVGLLQAARRTGDCLVVCLNSDASVRRRKGPGRPINPLADRVRVLRALECVDAVAVFDEDTPEELLKRLRPDVWVKGGDYALADLPEASLVESWGGQAVLLPYLDGRSSSRIAARAAVSVSATRDGAR